jgi:hypothetical protein
MTEDKEGKADMEEVDKATEVVAEVVVMEVADRLITTMVIKTDLTIIESQKIPDLQLRSYLTTEVSRLASLVEEDSYHHQKRVAPLTTEVTTVAQASTPADQSSIICAMGKLNKRRRKMLSLKKMANQWTKD